MREEMNRKRKQQFGKLVKFRYYQIGAMMGGIFFYMIIYRKFLVGTPVMHSVTYNQALEFIKANKLVKNKIGTRFQVMNCNGSMHKWKNDVKFDIVLFGANSNGKVKVISFYDTAAKTWRMKKIDLYTRTEIIPLI